MNRRERRSEEKRKAKDARWIAERDATFLALDEQVFRELCRSWGIQWTPTSPGETPLIFMHKMRSMNGGFPEEPRKASRKWLEDNKAHGGMRLNNSMMRWIVSAPKPTPPTDGATEMATTAQMYGTLEGNPATWITGHAGWWMPKGPDGDWVKIDSVEVSVNAQPMSMEALAEKFPGALDKLPSDAFTTTT